MKKLAFASSAMNTRTQTETTVIVAVDQMVRSECKTKNAIDPQDTTIC